MKIFFPQWQGAGSGSIIEEGATALLNYLGKDNFLELALSKLPAGDASQQKHQINNFEALVAQLASFKSLLSKNQPNHIHTLGGDCGLEIVPVSYLNAKYPNLGVIWFDAHADINRPCDSPSCNFHGMPLRTLLGEGEPGMNTLLFSKLLPEQIHYVGLREVDELEAQFITQNSIFSLTDSDYSSLIAHLNQKGITHIYLHFDFDCLNPKEYPYTYYQVNGGLSLEFAEDCISALKNEFKVVGSSALESVAMRPKEIAPISRILNTLFT